MFDNIKMNPLDLRGCPLFQNYNVLKATKIYYFNALRGAKKSWIDSCVLFVHILIRADLDKYFS